MSEDNNDLLAEAIKQAESQLVSLRARRQKWLNRFAEVEHVRGKAVERASCKASIRTCDEQIAAAEKMVRAAQNRATITEGREIVEEEAAMAKEAKKDAVVMPSAAVQSAGATALRTNATLCLPQVAEVLNLPPEKPIRRGTYLTGDAEAAFLATRNAETMLRVGMVKSVRLLPQSQGGHHG